MDMNGFLKAQAQNDLLKWTVQVEAARRFGTSYANVEEAALELGLLPARYLRNRNLISTAQQLTIFRSTIGVVGCGGLGGYVVEELARLGVGHLVVIDPDVFEEHNLNRQILSSIAALGRPKVDVAAERVGQINPAVKVKGFSVAFSEANGRPLLEGVNLVVDGLDNIRTRLELARVCSRLGLPLVHGSIGGWYGQVTTQLPGDDTLERVYGRLKDAEGIEKTLGNPSFTPAVVASLEVAEVCKLILRQGRSLSKRILFINLLDMEVEEVGP
jgi:molybdopterin/thiamine biosynthesis adenylyltransferase